MITRIWHGWTSPVHAAAYEALLLTTILPGIAARGIVGYRGAHVDRRSIADEVEFTTTLWFDTHDALVAFAGAGTAYDTAVVPSAARALLTRYDAVATHAETRACLTDAPCPHAAASAPTEAQARYTARILGYVGDRDPLPLLAAAPDTLDDLVGDLPAPIVRARPARDRWSIQEIVAHLADDELVGAYRLRLVLSAPGTPIQAFDQDAWADRGRYRDADVPRARTMFRVLREANLTLLRALSGEEWTRAGVHAERGTESVRDIAAYYAGHDLNHFTQIAAIRAAARGGARPGTTGSNP